MSEVTVVDMTCNILAF